MKAGDRSERILVSEVVKMAGAEDCMVKAISRVWVLLWCVYFVEISLSKLENHVSAGRKL